jgi:outer membrane protein OmpA-like peptidoglycan-associated protein
MRYIKQFTAVATLLAALGALVACGSVSRDIASDGSGAGTLVWPAPDSATPMHKGGTWPAPASLRRVEPGMNKRQLIDLLGPPHFHEGFWAVHEWNYLFHLRNPGSDEARVCQYKVLFDRDMLARSFYWKPASCADMLNPSTTQEQTFTLSADALFGFDKSAIADILPDGRQQLDELAQKLLARRDDIQGVRIVGYADRLGSDAHNESLSERRAYAVMRYLVQRGVPDHLMTAAGLGASDPVETNCTEDSRNALIACLAPNRRVEVRVFGKGQAEPHR